MFFYGSSMSGYHGCPALSVHGMLEFVGTGYVRGALYEVSSLADAPRRAGLQARGAGMVNGELWVIQKDPRRVLEWLDRLERYDPDDTRSGYRRAMAIVLPDEVSAWTYYGEHDKSVRIPLPGVRSWRDTCRPGSDTREAQERDTAPDRSPV